MSICDRISQEFRLTPALLQLRQYSPLSFGVERVFCSLQVLSLANLLLGTRRAAHDEGEASEEAMRARTLCRSRLIDLYLLIWALVIIVFLVYLAPRAPSCSIVRVIVCVILGYRVFEIAQVSVNLTLFDHLRITRIHSVSGITRTLLFTLWNYLEILGCFAAIYRAFPTFVVDSHGMSIGTTGEAIYFSAITQLTVGYGDLHPIGLHRGMAAVQGMLGLLFALLVLARFVTLLPPIKSIQGDDALRTPSQGIVPARENVAELTHAPQPSGESSPPAR